MTLDQRARTAARAVRDEVTSLDVPEHGPLVRRVARRRRVTAVLAGVAVLAAAGLGWSAVTSDDPSSTPLAVGDGGRSAWARVLKQDAGLAGSSLYDVASDGTTALVVGSVLGEDDWWDTAIWWSDDATGWQRADHPPFSGQVSSVAVHDGVALAFGTEGDREEPYRATFAWRSEDGGRTWADLDLPADALGPPAPEMGRPNAGDLAFLDGWWVAGGGSSTGYAGIWVSRTGEEWEQVLESRAAGGTSLVGLDDGRLLAYGATAGWITDDPTEWGPHHDLAVPSGIHIQSIAPGASLAVGREDLDGDTHLLRSDDGGLSWAVDDAFARDFPGVDLSSAQAFDGVAVLAGFDAESSPGAWVSVDGGPWQEIPEPLRRPPGGMLSLVTEVDDRIVALGGAPELDRFYVFRPGDGD